ncbi:MAG: preprotein translocase subunit SecG [Chloroflexi bacterium UTCFX4]|jgi:preprotein translocase subunit SecG|nr:MAG: preprotein translocase subunit SecG [Chloroflexi bacterium UTCFX4]
METVVNIVMIIISITLIVVLLLQIKGEGLSGMFGGDNPVYHQRRGLEATLYNVTIALSILFLVFALLSALVPTWVQ